MSSQIGRRLVTSIIALGAYNTRYGGYDFIIRALFCLSDRLAVGVQPFSLRSSQGTSPGLFLGY